jgi:hypothetical protein
MPVRLLYLITLRVFGWLVLPGRSLVGWPGGIAPPGSHRSQRDSLPSLGSSHPDHQNQATHRQCAINRGYCTVIRRHAAWAFLKPRSRLYLCRTHRIK